MNTQGTITDQIANISPIWIVAVILALTMVRVALAKSNDRRAMVISETCDTINFVLALAFLLIRPFAAQAFFIPSESMENTLQIGDRLIVDKVSYRFRDPQRGEVIVFNAPPRATDNAPNDIDYIKRLICLPGDTIQVKPARMIVDSTPVESVGDIHLYLRNRLGLSDRESVKLFPDYVLVGGQTKVTKAEIADKLGLGPSAKIELIPGQTIRNGEVLDEPYTREDPGYEYPNGGGSFTVPPGNYFVLGDNRNFSKDSHVWDELEKWRIVGRAVCLFLPPSRIGAIR